MSVKSIIAGFEQEKEQIQAKVTALKAREATLDLLLKELQGAMRGDKRGAKAAPKVAKAGVKKRKGITVRDSIIKAVGMAKGPLTAGAIIEKAVDLSGGAVPSIRTQINALTKAGELEQVPYEGRGFQYQIPAGKGDS